MKRFAGARFILLATLLCLFLVLAPAAHGATGDFRTACGTTGWYFAEGFTGGDFDTWILIQNPNQADTVATLRFFTPVGELQPLEVLLSGETRTTVYLNGLPGLRAGCEVATEVRVEGSGIVAERAMYFNYEGQRAGGHCSIGAPQPSCTWYLPEGYTGGKFDTYVLLMNPGSEDARGVWVKLMKPGEGRYYPFKVDVPAGRRLTVKLDDLVWTEGAVNYLSATYQPPGSQPAQVRFDDTTVSTWILSERPLVAERAMYFEYYGKAGGSSSIGATSAASTWYLPEGYTGGEFDTWVLAMNPNSFPVDITYTFFTNQPGSVPVNVTHAGVPPYSRDTICVDQVPGLQGNEVSTMVTACISGECSGASYPEGAAGIVAERSVYFRYGTVADGATSIGAPNLYGGWFLAEGYTGGGFDTYVLVMNPNDYWVRVTATYMTPEGAQVVKEYACPPLSRYTIKVDDQHPLLASADVSTRIVAECMEETKAVSAGYGKSCAAGVAVERAMYFVYRSPLSGKVISGGSCSIGFGE